MERKGLIEIVSNFLGRGDEAAKQRFETLLRDSGEVTLTITTKRVISAPEGAVALPPD